MHPYHLGSKWDWAFRAWKDPAWQPCESTGGQQQHPPVSRMAWVHVWARLAAVWVSVFLTLDRLQLSPAFRTSSLFSEVLKTVQVGTGHKNALGSSIWTCV